MAEGWRHDGKLCSSGFKDDEGSDCDTCVKFVMASDVEERAESEDLTRSAVISEGTRDISQNSNGIQQQVDTSIGRQYPGTDNGFSLNPRNSQLNSDTSRNPENHQFAERQLSFRTTETECPNLDSLDIPPEFFRNCMVTSCSGDRINDFNIAASIKPGVPSENIPVTTFGSSCIQPYISSDAGVLSENIPVTTFGSSCIQPCISSDDNVGLTNDVGITANRRGMSQTNLSDGGASSRASRSVSFRTPINHDTYVRKLPLDFMRFLYATFNPEGCKNWKDLVHLYNWNNMKIKNFKDKNHPDGIFDSLLNEEEFQRYKIEDLMMDLEAIPRLDAKEDLVKMINEYNSSL